LDQRVAGLFEDVVASVLFWVDVHFEVGVEAKGRDGRKMKVGGLEMLGRPRWSRYDVCSESTKVSSNIPKFFLTML
jgi:hypothetical protein